MELTCSLSEKLHFYQYKKVSGIPTRFSSGLKYIDCILRGKNYLRKAKLMLIQPNVPIK